MESEGRASAAVRLSVRGTNKIAFTVQPPSRGFAMFPRHSRPDRLSRFSSEKVGVSRLERRVQCPRKYSAVSATSYDARAEARQIDADDVDAGKTIRRKRTASI